MNISEDRKYVLLRIIDEISDNISKHLHELEDNMDIKTADYLSYDDYIYKKVFPLLDKLKDKV